MSVRNLPRLIRTIRHLRASQLIWRCRYTIARKLPPPRLRSPAREALEANGPVRRAQRFPDVPLFHRIGPSGAELVRDLAQGQFRHLNRAVYVGHERPDWHLGNPSAQRLWTITLHYHGWAYGLAEVASTDGPQAEEAAALLEHYLGDWIERCDVRRAGARDLAWNSFAIATRMGWWIRAYRLLLGRPERFSRHFRGRFLESLWRQAAYLHGHLEWDLRGNHLLRDLVGLAWAGRFFGGSAGGRWLNTATTLTAGQLSEQVLPDGAHFERSPMYHVHVMEDVLSLALLLQDPATVSRLTEVWLRMADYLNWLRDGEGRLPLLNDGAWKSGCEPERMLALAQVLGRQVEPTPPRGGRVFPDAGLVVWRGDPWVVFFDVGPIGPDEVPGHGHADTLTFECSYRGRRLFVDPGSYAYDRDERRRRDRSTGAHNTVCVDETDSSELWHIFRVGRRARPLDVQASFDPRGFQAVAAHTGYRHLGGGPIHRRRLSVTNTGALSITDTVEGGGGHHLGGGLLVDPEWSVHTGESGWRLSRDGLRLRVIVRSQAGLNLDVDTTPYHPEYGVELETRRLRWSYQGPLPVEVETEVAEA